MRGFRFKFVIFTVLLVWQNASMAETNLPALTDDLAGFCQFDDAGRADCVSGQEMKWRLQNRLAAIETFLSKANDVLRSQALAASAAARINGQMESLRRFVDSYRREMVEARERAVRQTVLIAQLNEGFNCRILGYNDGEQQTYYRETSLPECGPLTDSDYLRAARLMEDMARASIPQDAAVYLAKARAYRVLGPLVREVSQIHRQLYELRVLEDTTEGLRVHRVGHPFERDNHSGWMNAYVIGVAKLVRALDGLNGRFADYDGFNACPQPACDPTLFALAQAVTLRPPLDWVFLEEGNKPVAPNAYGLNYFAQRYTANTPIRRSVGLVADIFWSPNAETFKSVLGEAGPGSLVFRGVFPGDQVEVMVSGWNAKTEYPFALPLFYVFQEARGALDAAKTGSGRDLAAQIREIRFDRFERGGPLVAIDRRLDGLALRLNVLQPSVDMSAELVREELRRQIPAALQAAQRVSKRSTTQVVSNAP